MAALTKITDEDLLKKIKNVLGVTGDFNDEALEVLIMDVKYYLIDAGAHEIAVNSKAAVGAIARGVTDLWNLGSGTVNLSPYFKERAAQLALSYPNGADLKHEEAQDV